ncbi:MAG: hypothetical protein JXQ66_01925 [Campylobacterales bacterium]|nr:hypothetical protein [Campylobacterales bacterium]
MRFIAPKNTTYNMQLSSLTTFNAYVKGANVDFTIAENINDINLTAPFRAGIYDVLFQGEANSDIIYELENNDVIPIPIKEQYLCIVL